MQSIIAIAQHQQDAAKQHIQEAWTLNNSSPEAWLAESYRLQSQKQLNESLAAATQALEYFPGNTLTAARVSELHLMTGSPTKALDFAQQAVESSPENDLAQTALGFALLNTGKTSEARNTFQHALKLNSYSAYNHLGLGLSNIKLSEPKVGRQNLETAALLEPKN